MGISAFGTKLMSGQRQVETATVVCATGAITGDGTIVATMTSALLGGGTEAITVNVVTGDTPSIVAQKTVAALNLNADFLADFVATYNGANVISTAIVPAANEAGQNLALALGTATGMTAAPTSTDTYAGIAYTEIAHASNFSGPALSADIVDMTSHDSTSSFEEVAPTVLRTGELRMDIYYAPNAGTHDASTGVLYRYLHSILGPYQLRFPDAGHTKFTFEAYVTAFDPGEPVAGAIKAAVAFKIDGVPTLTDTW